jgi:hypothetical protein
MPFNYVMMCNHLKWPTLDKSWISSLLLGDIYTIWKCRHYEKLISSDWSVLKEQLWLNHFKAIYCFLLDTVLFLYNVIIHIRSINNHVPRVLINARILVVSGSDGFASYTRSACQSCTMSHLHQTMSHNTTQHRTLQTNSYAMWSKSTH